jgi:hypothetical protein
MRSDCRKRIKMQRLLYIYLLLTFCFSQLYSSVSLTGSTTQWLFRFCWILQYCSELEHHLQFFPPGWSLVYQINLCIWGSNSLHICQIIEVSKCPMLLTCQCPYPLNYPCLPPSIVTFSLLETSGAPECQFERVWDVSLFCTLVADVLTVTMSAVKREEGEAKATRSSLHHLQRHRENRLPKLFRPRSLFYQISMLSCDMLLYDANSSVQSVPCPTFFFVWNLQAELTMLSLSCFRRANGHTGEAFGQ